MKEASEKNLQDAFAGEPGQFAAVFHDKECRREMHRALQVKILRQIVAGNPTQRGKLPFDGFGIGWADLCIPPFAPGAPGLFDHHQLGCPGRSQRQNRNEQSDENSEQMHGS